MVRQATATAVSASISTPVCPLILTLARTISPGRRWSGSMSTAICEMASGWQSGISSWVFFAAMMPAMRAAPSTSPFLALPLRTRSSVDMAIATRPSATATRSVAALAETSTMRASPPLARWVNLGVRAKGSPRRAEVALVVGKQRARRRRNIRLPHQALADQEGRNADRGERLEIGGAGNSALADGDAVARDFWRQQAAGRQRGVERLEVAVVDADQPRAPPQRALKFALIVDFEQHVHAVVEGRVLEVGRDLVVDRRHDDQDAVGAPRARLDHLVDVIHEILAQHRQAGGRARRHQVLGGALERGVIGQHREAGGAARRIGACMRRRVEVGADEALGRARLLDLGDQRIVAGGAPSL